MLNLNVTTRTLWEAWLKRLEAGRSWQLVVKRERALVGALIRVSRLWLGDVNRSWILSIISFSRFCLRLRAHRGSKGLAIYLKTCSILLMKLAAGERVKDLSPYGCRVACTGAGVPRIIPKIHRRALLSCDPRFLRFWLTLFGLYRVLDFRARFSVSTIVTPGPSLNLEAYSWFIPYFFSDLEKMGCKFEFPLWDPLELKKAAPGTQTGPKRTKGGVWTGQGRMRRLIWIQTSMSVLVEQAVQFFNFADLLSSLKKVGDLLGPEAYPRMETFKSLVAGTHIFPWPLGKLGVKEEPGKKRVFAMVDWWTQTLLFPLHKAIFGSLRFIPQDSTFDQMKGVRRACEEVREGYVASLDLSAATDRLPVSLQSLLVDHLKPGLGGPWKDLLVGRAYRVPKKYSSVAQQVFYACGQPMGAYSSWAMLALTHHFLVQLSARRAGAREWFTRYAVLGDDVLIWDRHVVHQYLELMRELGVGISMHKSLVSNNGTFEYAKRFVAKGVDCTPLPLREAAAASSSLDALLLLLNKFRRDWRPADVLAFLGKGYKVRGSLSKALRRQSRVVARTLVFLAQPGLSQISFASWYQWFGMVGINSSRVLPLEDLGVKLNSLLDYYTDPAYSEHARWMRPTNYGTLEFIPPLEPAEPGSDLEVTDKEIMSQQIMYLLLPIIGAKMYDAKQFRLSRPENFVLTTESDFDKAFQAFSDYISRLDKTERYMPDFCKIKLEESKRRPASWWMKVWEFGSGWETH